MLARLRASYSLHCGHTGARLACITFPNTDGGQDHDSRDVFLQGESLCPESSKRPVTAQTS